MEYIKVPTRDWLNALLEKHAPDILDIGDQREPWDVVICSCGNFGYDEIKPIPYAEKSTAYSRHLQEVLETNYYNRLDQSDMR